jgi:hypothetical protein
VVLDLNPTRPCAVTLCPAVTAGSLSLLHLQPLSAMFAAGCIQEARAFAVYILRQQPTSYGRAGGSYPALSLDRILRAVLQQGEIVTIALPS